LLTSILQKLIIRLKDASKLVHLEEEESNSDAEGLLGGGRGAGKRFEGLEKQLAR
jgi:hypothetical protein